MKRSIYIVFLLVLALTSCNESVEMNRVLTAADSLLTVQPDSALRYLEAHARLKGEGSRSQRMRYELLRATAQNKAYVDFTTDSVMKQVADYYDHHGTANQQLQAHYLLGCVYRDLGDAPRAIECYLDAVEKADTTAEDCDYKTMGATYSQMAGMYHRQLLLNNEIEARRQASHYAFVSGDTLLSIHDYKMIAGAYILQCKSDSAELILNKAIQLYHYYGYKQESLEASLMLMHLYTEQPDKLFVLKHLIDQFESETNLFDDKHELPPSKHQYYYYKGKYYEGIHQLDSAELCYRKIYYPNISYLSANPMYKGMLSVYRKRQEGDSIAKYADLYCISVDSSTILKDREITAQMAATYDYTLYQKKALVKEQKANRLEIKLIVISLLLGISVLGTVAVVRRNKISKCRQIAKYNTTLSERNKMQKELEKLKEKNYDAVIEQKEKLIRELNHSLGEYESMYRQVLAKDHLDEFKKYEIVKSFEKMSEFKKGIPLPTNTDWKRLVDGFSCSMPSTYAMMTRKETALSDLQLHVCILLLLGYEESVIAALKGSSPQTINCAKVRANKKLFQCKDSASLKANLMGIAGS